MSPWRIRPLADHPDWIEQVAAWFCAEWPDLYVGHSLEEVAQQLALGAKSAWVAEAGGRPLGVVVLKEREGEQGEPVPWLAALYVVPERRRQGLGSRLVGVAQAQAARRHGELFLYTRDGEGFYRRLGWEVSERVQAPGGPAVVMRRRLS